jgi:hypothetical protein
MFAGPGAYSELVSSELWWEYCSARCGHRAEMARTCDRPNSVAKRGGAEIPPGAGHLHGMVQSPGKLERHMDTLGMVFLGRW